MLNPNTLFYYCKLATAIEDILPNMQLLLSPLTGTNDPRENKVIPFGADFFNDPNQIVPDNFKDGKQKFCERLHENCKLLCFSGSYNDFFGYEYSAMWAHYGDRHHGVCLGIDKQMFIEENKKIINSNYFNAIDYYKFNPSANYVHLPSIDYDKWNEDEKKYISDFRNEHLNFLYFTKNKEWEYEREIRLIHFSSNICEKEYCTIEKSLRHIYLGVDFNKNYLPSIKEICPKLPITTLRFSSAKRLVIDKTI